MPPGPLLQYNNYTQKSLLQHGAGTQEDQRAEKYRYSYDHEESAEGGVFPHVSALISRRPC